MTTELVDHIKLVILDYHLENEIYVRVEDNVLNYATPSGPFLLSLYASNDKNPIDSLIICLTFNNTITGGEDEGFIIEFCLYYKKDTVIFNSDICRGIIQESHNVGAISNSCWSTLKYDDLSGFKEILEDYRISKLLIKEYLFDYHLFRSDNNVAYNKEDYLR